MIRLDNRNRTVQQAAILLLVGLLVQLLAGAAISLLKLHNTGVTCAVSVAFFALSGAGALVLYRYQKICVVALATAGAGIVLSFLYLTATYPVNTVSWTVKCLLFVALYLPMQRALDAECVRLGTSERTRRMGRLWSWTVLLRFAVTAAELAVLSISAAGNADGLGAGSAEMKMMYAASAITITLFAISVYYQIRYLWRIQYLFKD